MEKDEQEMRNQRKEQQKRLKEALENKIKRGIITLSIPEDKLLNELVNLMVETSAQRNNTIYLLLQITHPDATKNSIYKEIYNRIFNIVILYRSKLNNMMDAEKLDANDAKTQNDAGAGFKSSGDGSAEKKSPEEQKKENHSEWFRRQYKSPFEGTGFGDQENEDKKFMDFINKSFDFSYPDGTKISLKFLEKIINKNDKTNILYKYEFVGEDKISQDFYSEFTPQELLIDLDQNNPGILMNYYLHPDRIKKIFRKICPSDLNVNECFGNGYAGYFEKKDDKYMIKSNKWGWDMTFEDQGKQFEEKMKKNSMEFIRKNAKSSFSLQFIEKIELYKMQNIEGGTVYKYWFQDPNYNNGNKLELYIDHSPTQILEMMYKKKRKEYFANVLLGSIRLDKIFGKADHTNGQKFGNGYGGFIDWKNGRKIGNGIEMFPIEGIQAEFMMIYERVSRKEGREAS